jgi:hypothetical protein
MAKVVYQAIKRLVDKGGQPDLLVVAALSGKSVSEVMDVLDKNITIARLNSLNNVITDGWFFHITEEDWHE